MKTLLLQDGSISYDDVGSGPLVVMLPGLGDIRQEYRYLAPRLADAGFRSVTADLRGHGGSSVGWPDYSSASAGQDLVALIEELDGGPAVVVGNSFGAGPAAWAAAERPELISRLVLIGPFVRDHELPLHMRLLMRIAFSGPWKVRAWDMYYASLFPTRKPEDLESHRAALRANLSEPGRFAAVQAMLNRSDAEIEARLERVTAPTLVIMGSKDPDFPDPAVEANWIAQRLGGEAGTRMIEGAGHYPQTEMPDETAQAVLDFIGMKEVSAG